jgi:hypothetical protein
MVALWYIVQSSHISNATVYNATVIKQSYAMVANAYLGSIYVRLYITYMVRRLYGMLW